MMTDVSKNPCDILTCIKQLPDELIGIIKEYSFEAHTIERQKLMKLELEHH